MRFLIITAPENSPANPGMFLTYREAAQLLEINVNLLLKMASFSQRVATVCPITGSFEFELQVISVTVKR